MNLEELSNIEKEYIVFDHEQAWNPVFQRLRNQAAVMHKVSVTVAQLPQNRPLNRYRDVSPYDQSRVHLIKGENDYINACHVHVPSVDRKYILTQGPLEATCGHFWQMVFEQRSEAVLMLNRVFESGTLKCAQYFPAGRSVGHVDELIFEDVQLKVRLCNERNLSYFVIRELELTCVQSGVSRMIKHFHYLAWPDFGVPQSPAAFLSFLIAVRRAKVLDPDLGPAVVHCSAGIGRSGTFCVVDACLLMVERQRSLADVDLQGVVLDLRGYRMGLIQTAQQLRFSYQAVLEAAHTLLAAPEDTPFESLVFVPEEAAPAKVALADEESSDEIIEDIVVCTDSDSVRDSNSDLESPPPLPARDYHAPAETAPDHNKLTEKVGDAKSIHPKTSDPSVDVNDIQPELPAEVLGDGVHVDEELVTQKEIKPSASLPDLPEPQQSSSISETSGPTPNPSDNFSQDSPHFGLRRRPRAEIKQRTQLQIEHMKERQRATQVWKERRRRYTRPLFVGLAVAVTSSLLFYLFSGY